MSVVIAPAVILLEVIELAANLSVVIAPAAAFSAVIELTANLSEVIEPSGIVVSTSGKPSILLPSIVPLSVVISPTIWAASSRAACCSAKESVLLAISIVFFSGVNGYSLNLTTLWTSLTPLMLSIRVIVSPRAIGVLNVNTSAEYDITGFDNSSNFALASSKSASACV